MENHTLSYVVDGAFEREPLWSSGYKIPWNLPEFSKRMLREHLSQEHDLASRSLGAIERQAQWIDEKFLAKENSSVLDLGCGPGLYSRHFKQYRHKYLGIDFSPASISYANENFAGRDCEFVLADIRNASYKGPHDLVMLLYGEFNVFSPGDAVQILSRVHDSLKPGGLLLLEVYAWDAVKSLGTGSSWTAFTAGLFSDTSHLCLMKNQWFPREETTRQLFYIVDAESAEVQAMCSTTKAWSDERYQQLLAESGLADVRFEPNWPLGREEFFLISARKPLE